MSSMARKSGGGLFEGLYRVVIRRNSVYVTFVIAGAFLGERAVDYGVHRLWEYNNVGNDMRTYLFWGRGQLTSRIFSTLLSFNVVSFLKFEHAMMH